MCMLGQDFEHSISLCCYFTPCSFAIGAGGGQRSGRKRLELGEVIAQQANIRSSFRGKKVPETRIADECGRSYGDNALCS